MKKGIFGFIFLVSPMILAFQSEGLYPWLTNNANFRSRLIFNNVENQEIQLTLTATRADGSTETAVRTVAPFGQLSEGTDTLFPTLGEGPGYAVVAEGSLGEVNGAFVISSQSGASGSSPAQGDVVDPAAASQILMFNFLPVGGGGASAPVIVNTGSSDAEVVFHAYQNGAEVGTSAPVTVAPGRPFADITANLFPGVEGEVYVVAESSEPLAGIAFIFNGAGEPSMANSRALSAVPDLGGEPAEVRVYEGITVTGTNYLLGEPVMDIPYGFGTAGADNIGAYNPDQGGLPLALTPDLLPNAYEILLCAGYGLTPNLGDNFNSNVLINDVPVVVGYNGVFFQRGTPAPILEAEQAALSLAAPHDPVSLGRWLEANGKLYVRCLGDNRAELTLVLKRLMANRLYTIWAGFGDPTDFIIAGFGGLPNGFSTDETGGAVVRRTVNYCPYHIQEGQLNLVFLELLFHSDHMVYGAIPTTSSLGKDAHTHMHFFLEGTPVSNKTGAK